MKSIIVEGFDNSGKSTLINSLQKFFYNYEVIKSGPRPKNWDIECKVIDNHINLLKTHKIILDRFSPISSFCYSKEDYLFVKNIIFNDIYEVLQNSIIIYCKTNSNFESHIQKNYDTNDWIDYVKINELVIKNNYEELFLEIPHIKYDYQTENKYVFFNQIQNLITKN